MIRGSFVTGRYHAETGDRDRTVVGRTPRVIGALVGVAHRVSATCPVQHAGEAFFVAVQKRPRIDVTGVAQSLQTDIGGALVARRSGAIPHIQVAYKNVRRTAAGALKECDRLTRLEIVTGRLVGARR